MNNQEQSKDSVEQTEHNCRDCETYTHQDKCTKCGIHAIADDDNYDRSDYTETVPTREEEWDEDGYHLDADGADIKESKNG